MYNGDNLNDMIAVLEQYKYEYTKYYHANGCCAINSTLLLNQLKLNEQKIRAKTIDEFAEAFDKWIKSDAKRTYYWTEFQVEFMKIAEQMKGGAE